MESVGYGITSYLASGQLTIFSRFGTVAESKSDVTLTDVLDSPAIKFADIVVFDSASSLMPDLETNEERFKIMKRLREEVSTGRSFLLCIDPDAMDTKLLHALRESSEVVLDLMTNLIGGTLNRTILVTRFLRAAGPVQSTIGWRVEPGMGFIVDITAVS